MNSPVRSAVRLSSVARREELRRLHGSDVHGQPSRFLHEIPTELIEEIRPRINVSRPVAFVQSAYRMEPVQPEAGAD